jgi:hypothetical protein
VVLGCSVASALAHEWGPPGVTLLGNSASFWICVAFFVARAGDSRSSAALRGLTALLGLAVGYYSTILLLFQRGEALPVLAYWIVLALLTGPVAGLCAWWSRSPRPWWHVLGASLPAATCIAEALFIHRCYADQPAWALWTQAALGSAATAVLVRRGCRTRALVTVAVSVTVVTALLHLTLWAYYLFG